jgi:uncharacterized phage-associated protein
MMMSYDARQIANWFIERAAREGRALSIMSILKLIYFAHGWHLEIRKSPLIRNRIEAWQYGPVIPEVYQDFRTQGVEVTRTVPVQSDGLDSASEDLLEQIYNIYGQMTPFRLSDLTHEDGGPWHIARQMGGWYAMIPDDLIRAHFSLKRARSNELVDV